MKRYIVLVFWCLRWCICLIFPASGLLAFGQTGEQDSIPYYTNLILEAKRDMIRKPDLSYEMLQSSYDFFYEKGDTSQVIHCLIWMSEIKKKTADFSLTFDHLWEAQYMANQADNLLQKAELHVRLAKLYDVFGMDKKVLEHINELLSLARQFQDSVSRKRYLTAGYMNLAVRQRKMENYIGALLYLDSCQIIRNDNKEDIPYWDAEYGLNMLRLGRFPDAKTALFRAFDASKGMNVPYLANVNMYIGDFFTSMDQPDSALEYYQRSLFLIKNRLYRNDLEADVLAKVSASAYSLGYINYAFEKLIESKEVADKWSYEMNRTNGELFEMKNSYLEALSEQEDMLEKQELRIAHNQEIQLRLKIILGLTILLVIVIYVVYRLRLKLRRTLLDKKEAEINEEMQRAKVEMKSKELTAYALQLINKDTTIDELLEALKVESETAYRSHYGKIKRGSQDMWDEFNLRFTEVNSAFYERLKSKHENLSSTEQKHCALIKLGFTTKEMARILHIEPHSVNISRSRIRKKMNLDRSVNLDDYISKI